MSGGAELALAGPEEGLHVRGVGAPETATLPNEGSTRAEILRRRSHQKSSVHAGLKCANACRVRLSGLQTSQYMDAGS